MHKTQPSARCFFSLLLFEFLHSKSIMIDMPKVFKALLAKKQIFTIKAAKDLAYNRADFTFSTLLVMYHFPLFIMHQLHLKVLNCSLSPIKSTHWARDFLFCPQLMFCPVHHAFNMKILSTTQSAERNSFQGCNTLKANRTNGVICQLNSLCFCIALTYCLVFVSSQVI